MEDSSVNNNNNNNINGSSSSNSLNSLLKSDSNDELNQSSLMIFQKDEYKIEHDEKGSLIRECKKLTTLRKFLYAVGGMPYQMTSNAIALFVAPFLLDIANLSPAQVSVVLFLAGISEAITDPLIGYFSNRTNTRFGKYRPWVICSAPFVVLSFMGIWYVPDIEDQGTRTCWYIITYCLFQTFISSFHVPYTSLTMALTSDQADRDSATTWRMTFEIIGTLLGVIVQGVMLSIVGSSTPCERALSEENNSNDIQTMSSDTSKDKLKEGYLVSAAILSLIYIICCLTTFLGTKEMKDVMINDEKRDFSTIMKNVFNHKSYRSLLLLFLIVSTAVQLIASNFALFCKYSIHAGDQYQYLVLALLVSTLVFLPLWQYVTRKHGKKKTFAIGLIFSFPNLIALFFLNEPIWGFYVIAVLLGCSASVNYLLPWTMLPDVIDEFMIKTGERSESIFYSFFEFFKKLSYTLSVAMSILVLEFVGYRECLNTCCTQPKSVALTLRILIVPVPVVLLLIGMILLWRHPINENRRKEIKDILILIRTNKVKCEIFTTDDKLK